MCNVANSSIDLQWRFFEKIVLILILIHRYACVATLLLFGVGIFYLYKSSLLFTLMWQGMPMSAEIAIQGIVILTTTLIWVYSHYHSLFCIAVRTSIVLCFLVSERSLQTVCNFKSS